MRPLIETRFSIVFAALALAIMVDGLPAQSSPDGAATLLLDVRPEGRLADPVAVGIPSHGAVMAGHVHVGAGPAPRHTVLLFPGFGSSGRELLGLGAALSAEGVNVVMFAPRGWHDSEGEFTGTGAIDDARAVFDWLHREDVVHRFGVDTARITVGGFSFGAATVLAFAARDRSVLLISGLYDGETWMPQLEYMHLPLYRALRAEGAPDVGFRMFMDEHAFTASRAELAEALLGWLRACEAGSPCEG